MQYAFFGSPRFAEIILKKLIDAGMPPAVLVCNPDRPVGRKQIITPPPTKVLALQRGIAVWQPENLKIEDFKSKTEELGGVDFAVVAAYAKIIPKSILEILPAGFVGIHPSLIPKYRGTTPIQTAILEGAEETGVTLYILDENIDHGAIAASKTCAITGSDTYGTLEEKLAELGGELLIETLPKLAAGTVEPKAQNENEATYTKKFSSEDGFVEWSELEKAQREGSETAVVLDRKIRALAHEPGAWTMRPDGKRMKLLEAVLSSEKKLILKRIQIEGKKETGF